MTSRPDASNNGLPFFNAHPHWARALYLFCLTAVLTFASIWIVRFASIVTDENWYTDIDGKVTVIEVLPGGVSDRAGLRAGDIIMAINGVPVRDMFDANDYLQQSRGGDALVYTVERDGETLDLTIYTAVFGLPLFYLAHILIGISFISIGTWVFLRRYRHPIARLLGWSHLVLGFALLISQSYSYWFYPDTFTSLGYLLSPLSWALAIGSLMHLLLYFPAQRFVRAVRRIDIAMIYAAPLALFLAIPLGSAFPLTGLLRSLLMVGLTAIAVTVVQILLARRYRLYESVEYRERFPKIRVAIILGILFIAGSLAVTNYSSWQAIFLLGLASPALFFSTIVRYRIFDLYVVLRRGSLYGMLTTVLTTCVVLLFFILLLLLPQQHWNMPVLHVTSEQIEMIRLHALTPEQRMVYEKRMSFLAGALAIALLWWLHRQGKRRLDRRFFRGSYDYKRALTAFSKLSHSYADSTLLATAVVGDLVNLMHLKGAVFAIRSDGGFRPLASNGLHIDTDLLLFGNEGLSSLDTAFARDTSLPIDNLRFRDRFAGTGVEFLTASHIDGHAQALLLLGEKQSETNYSREDVELLENLAINISDALTTMRFYEGARDKERMRKELEIARSIQLDSLPDEIPDLPGIDVAAKSLPAYEVGGDFYDFLPRHDAMTFVIGDVSGKGTSAALYLSRIQGILKTVESYQPGLWELLVRINTQIFDHIERRSFVTMAALRVELLRNEVTFLRAGHLPLLHYNALSREIIQHQPAGLAIGLDMHSFAERLEEEKIFVRGGDVFVLLSDGITEAENDQGRQFGMEGVIECLREHATQNAAEIQRALLECVDRWAGSAERGDDQTIVVIKFAI
ncbi:MAG: SpoIIE family protein phosphatase [Bacteroidetes bacterium]|nr:SpoIIE family protein phosphatase [Bacteroidota bacterium]